ncbi:MAG: ribosome maturation factor RimM [Geobacteraceae bacterium]|nr:ribosome maturation factor RimM [Geobacteraceae bacterium]
MNAIRTTQEFCAGVITSSHGLKGEVRIRPEKACAPALYDAPRYKLRLSAETSTPVEIRRAVMHKQMVLASLAGYSSVDSVADFVGAEVWIDPDTLPEVRDGNFYWHQLKGLQVVDREAGNVGILADLLSTPGHDIYVVDGPYGEVMIPAVGAMVQQVDLSAGTMYVSLPQGLLELN